MEKPALFQNRPGYEERGSYFCRCCQQSSLGGPPPESHVSCSGTSSPSWSSGAGRDMEGQHTHQYTIAL